MSGTKPEWPFAVQKVKQLNHDSPNEPHASPPGGFPSAFNYVSPMEPSIETLSRVHTRTMRGVPKSLSGVGNSRINGNRKRNAKLTERCSDGVENQGAEEALRGESCFRQFWKPAPVRASLLSARGNVMMGGSWQAP